MTKMKFLIYITFFMSLIACSNEVAVEIDFAINGKIIPNSETTTPPSISERGKYVLVHPNQDIFLHDLIETEKVIENQFWQIPSIGQVKQELTYAFLTKTAGFIRIGLCYTESDCVYKWIYIESDTTESTLAITIPSVSSDKEVRKAITLKASSNIKNKLEPKTNVVKQLVIKEKIEEKEDKEENQSAVVKEIDINSNSVSEKIRIVDKKEDERPDGKYAKVYTKVSFSEFRKIISDFKKFGWKNKHSFVESILSENNLLTPIEFPLGTLKIKERIKHERPDGKYAKIYTKVSFSEYQKIIGDFKKFGWKNKHSFVESILSENNLLTPIEFPLGTLKIKERIKHKQ